MSSEKPYVTLSFSSSSLGADMAVSYINRNRTLLPNYELVLLRSDTQCRSDLAIRQYIRYYGNTTQPIAGIVGMYYYILY